MTQKKQFLIAIKIMIIMMPALFASSEIHCFPALPIEIRKEREKKIREQIESRWNKLKELKKGEFARFERGKTDLEIQDEFRELNDFRNNLWYRNPKKMPLVSNEDYTIAQGLLKLGNDQYPLQWLAFEYNHIDNTYNASSIFMDSFHFIALKEPTCNTLNAFFEILMNHDAKILVRLNPEIEHASIGINYWEDKVIGGPNHQLIQTKMETSHCTHEGAIIPYFSIENWKADSEITVEELFDLVINVKSTHIHQTEDGPIACHCSDGAGRTGTFIAACIISDFLDRYKPKHLSIESIVLKLSIQRPKMVLNEDQYLLLYRFVDYYTQKLGFANTEL